MPLREVGEKTSTSVDKMSTMCASLGQLLTQMKEDGEKDREIQKEKNRENLKEFIDKLEALEISQQRQLEAQKATTKIPLPKYNGEANSHDDWKQAMLICIKGNGWTDEKRIIEMLPSCFTGPAYKIFLSSPCTEETTIESLFLAMTKIFDPNGKTRNREFFARKKKPRRINELICNTLQPVRAQSR